MLRETPERVLRNAHDYLLFHKIELKLSKECRCTLSLLHGMVKTLKS
jgi:hypothetical protein